MLRVLLENKKFRAAQKAALFFLLCIFFIPIKTFSCSENVKVLTSKGQVDIKKIKIGDYVITDHGEPVPVVRAQKTKVYNFKIRHIEFSDGTELDINPSQPTFSQGLSFGALKIGDKVDNRRVLATKLVPYKYKYIYDILPNSYTGNYYANGVLVGSTMYMSSLNKNYP